LRKRERERERERQIESANVRRLVSIAHTHTKLINKIWRRGDDDEIRDENVGIIILNFFLLFFFLILKSNNNVSLVCDIS